MKLTPIERPGGPRGVRYLVHKRQITVLHNWRGEPRYYWRWLRLPIALNPFWAWLRPRDLRGFILALALAVAFACAAGWGLWRLFFGARR